MLFHLNWPGWHVFTCLHCRWETAQKISILHTPCYACGRWLKSGHRECFQRKIFPSLGCEGWERGGGAWGRSWGGQLSGVWIREGAGTQQGHANLDMCIAHCNCTPSSCFNILHCSALYCTEVHIHILLCMALAYSITLPCIAWRDCIALHWRVRDRPRYTNTYIQTSSHAFRIVSQCITMQCDKMQRHTMQCNALYDVALKLVRVRELLLTGAQLEPALRSHWLAIVVTLITIIVITIIITLISK